MVDVVADTDDYPSLIESGHHAELQFLCLKMGSSRPVTGQTSEPLPSSLAVCTQTDPTNRTLFVLNFVTIYCNK